MKSNELDTAKSIDNQWLVLRAKSRAEKKLAAFLQLQGWSAHAITYTTMRQWSDRKKKVELPIIPGVVFAKYEEQILEFLYHCPLVASVLKEYGQPALVKQFELNNLLLIAKEWSGEQIIQTVNEHFEKGDLVEVTSGDFQGLIGELITIKGKYRLVVNIHALNIAFTVELPKSKVKHLNTQKVVDKC